MRIDPRGISLLALALLALVGESPRGVVAAQQPAAQQPAESIPDAALAQIAALAQEKAARTPAERKVSSRILYAIKMQRGEQIAPGVQLRQPSVRRDAAGRLDLDVTARAGTNLRAVLTASGANVVGVNVMARGGAPAGSTARAYVDAERVMTLAARADITAIRPHHEVMLNGASRQLTSSIGSKASEGDLTHRAELARSAFGVDGTGIRIGVLSDGVANLAQSQAAGDLGPVTVLPGQAGSGDEGTAMLEIIHDLAPGAELYFASGFGSIAQFAQNIRDLRAAGCDIIVDDLLYYVESPLHDGQPASNTTSVGGIVAQAVNDVVASGALYFSSAGNSGNLNDGTSGVWEGDFVGGGTVPPPLAGGGSIHNFLPGQNWNQLTASGSQAVALHWADPLGGSGNDYDIYILDASMTTVFDASTDVQDGDDEPVEIMGQAFGNERLVVALFSGSPRFLHLNTHRGRLSVATAGQTGGHSAAAGAFSVAATPAAAAFSGPNDGPYPGPFTIANKVEPFSSDGPRRLFFNADGTPITPGDFSATGGLIRQKPDITAADGVQVTGAGGFSSPFYGTSAAAPHAAAIAALLKQARPAATPSEIRTWLTSSALDIETAGVDRDSGAGIIMPVNALVAAGASGTPILSATSFTAEENPGNGDGLLYGGEGGRLTVGLTNVGFSTATGIQATLTTSTPGVTIAQPATRSYPDLAISASANAATPFTFTLPTDAACGLTVAFTLTVTRTGSSTPEVFPISVPTGVVNITQTFDGAASSSPPLYTASAGQQSVSLTRNGTASTCGAAKPFPGSTVEPSLGFEAYTFTTCSSAPSSCATVSLAAPSGTSQQLFSTAHTGGFNPTDLAAGYAGDLGATHTDGASASYGISLAAGSQTFTVAVSEIASGAAAGATYGLRVSGACLASCTRNRVPLAIVHDVTLPAGPGNVANASIDNGSNDPDGDPLTFTLSPAGPYPLGTTAVMLTVTDDKGATSQASAMVTVAPAVTVTGLSPSTGVPDGGTVVTITGTGFSTTPGGTTIVFGGAPATNVACASSVTCQATSPAGAGVVSVRVTASNLTSPDTPADDFTYIAPPAIASIAPARGAIAGGTIVTITGSGFSTAAGATTIRFGATAATNVTCTSTTTCVATSPAGSGTVSVRATVGDQTSMDTSADDFAYSTQVYLLAEGATGAFFDEDVAIVNPNSVPAPITAAFYTEDGATVVETRTLPAQSRLTIHVDTVPGLEAASAAAAITSEQGLPLAVERSMFWDATYYAGHTGPALAAPATQWYFAEGSEGFFHTFVLVNNPNGTPADVTFTFLREQDAPVTRTVTVPATSRSTLAASSVDGLVDRSFAIAVSATQPVTTDRAMYFGDDPVRPFGGGMTSPGVALSPVWHFAEGATGSFFDTFLLLGNPQNTDAHITLTYLLDSGEVITAPVTIAANQRLTINPEVSPGIGAPDARLQDAQFAISVTSDVSIVAERSMYWSGKAQPWGEGHSSPGLVAPALTWDVAEGRTGGAQEFHTYLLVSNPQSTAADLSVTYLRETGAPIVRTYTVPATARLTIDVNAVPELANQHVGARVAVTNNQPVIVERSMYWNANGIFWAGGSNGMGIAAPVP